MKIYPQPLLGVHWLEIGGRTMRLDAFYAMLETLDNWLGFHAGTAPEVV